MDSHFWDEIRANGVGHTIDLSLYDSVIQMFQESCQKYADRPAYSSLGVTLYFSDMERLSSDFAGYLQKKTHLEPGDKLAICLPNVLQFPIAVFGALKAGLVVVNINPMLTEREMKYQLCDSGAKALVFLDMVGDTVEAVLSETQIEFLVQASLGDMHTTGSRFLVNLVAKYLKKKIPHFKLPQAVPFLEMLNEGYELGFQSIQIKPEDQALLQYSMGTTGISKGAILSHKNLVANMLQVKEALSEQDSNGIHLVQHGREVVIAALPLYHIYAFTCHCLCMFYLGNHNVLVSNPKDMDSFMRVLRKWRFTAIVGLNTLFIAMMNNDQFNQLDFTDLKITLSGGSALARNTAEKWLEKTGKPIVEGYGLTEASPVVAVNSFLQPRQGSVGVPLPETLIKISDQLGNELPLGQVGEICVKGPQVFQGYWNAPDITAMSLKDGWLFTGDMAYVDEMGCIHIVDRKKDLIIVSGFNVYPNEIENVVSDHDRVHQCAAIGVPDSYSGEVVKLFVVPKDPDLTEQEILTWCRSNLAGYKVPKTIEFRNHLPLTAVGKILRRELKPS